MTVKKIKIHVKNNHWAPGSFPTDAEGEKNFTITKEHLDEALKNNNFDGAVICSPTKYHVEQAITL